MNDTPHVTKLQVYCSALYDLMDRESEAVGLSDGVTAKVWRGSVTQSAKSVGAGEGVYSRVVERLKDIGCITVLETGRRNVPSLVALHYPPTPEIWAREISPERLTKPPDSAMLLAEVRAMRENAGGVNVPLALKNIEDRLLALEQKVAKLESQ